VQRSDARLAHAEAEARRALVAQKIAANRAVFVQQKLISMRLQVRNIQTPPNHPLITP
jgi:hypothetical protein